MGYEIWDTGYGIRDTGYEMRDTGYGIRDDRGSHPVYRCSSHQSLAKFV